MSTQANAPKEEIMISNKKALPRRILLCGISAAVSLPMLEFSAATTASAQEIVPLWRSAAILIGNGGILLTPDLVQCPLFDQNGQPVANGSVTSDFSTLGVNGIVKFTWRTSGGKLEGNFRFPDAKTTFAFTPIPGGAPNHFYILLSDDHVLATDLPSFVAEGFFTSINRVVTKCQYAVQIDGNGVPHPLAPFCTKCTYMFVR
jgi:hypothetical protein